MFYSNLENFKSVCGYEIDGIWYPRVTSIISIKAKPALYKYYADLPDFKTAEAIKTKSAGEGTLIHETVEAILEGREAIVPDSIRPAIDAFRNFYESHNIVVHKVEERVVSKKHWYAGTLDVLAEVDGKLGVLDIKTSYSIFRDFSIQTSAYIEALKEIPSLPPLAGWILRIDQCQKCLKCPATLRVKGGNIKIRGERGQCLHSWSPLKGECELKELTVLDRDIKAFFACKNLWEWEHEYWIRQLANQTRGVAPPCGGPI